MATSLSGSVNDFFESYAAALERYDAKLMAQHYNVPCSFLSDEAVTVFTESSKLEGLFNQGAVFYKQFGIAHAKVEVRSKNFWTERMVKVKMSWHYFDGDNQPVYSCDYHYILRLNKHNQWKIEVSVSLNEKERMEAWLGKRRDNTAV